MNRFDYRVWDTEEKVMITGREVLQNFKEYVENERYIVMESLRYIDKNGTTIFEGDYIAEEWHGVKGVCTYAIKEIVYDEKNRQLGERYVKNRVVYHDTWQDESCNKEHISTSLLSISGYDKKYQVIGNKYQSPEIVEMFRPNYKEITKSTGWVDQNGEEIYDYHVLLLPSGSHRVVEFNTKYKTNANQFFLRPIESLWGNKYTENLLTKELAKESVILTHTFLDEKKEKVNIY